MKYDHSRMTSVLVHVESQVSLCGRHAYDVENEFSRVNVVVFLYYRLFTPYCFVYKYNGFSRIMYKG